MSVKSRVQARWQAWLERRLPRIKKIRLTQRNTFIFPSEEGIAFLVVVVLVFIGGINYENSLMLGTAFLLASLFLISIVSTYLNLAGLTLSAERAEPAYAGELAFVEVMLHCDTNPRYGITLMLGAFREELNLQKNQQNAVLVPFEVLQRGKGYPPRILLESRYPLGLIRAWTWIAFDQYAVVYPKPLRCDLQATGDGLHGKKQTIRQQNDEEYAGIREYRPGDSLKSIHWKHFAKSGEVFTRYREGATASTLVLTLESVPGQGIETKLSQLAWWSKELNRQNIAYALKLPGISISAAQGPQHLYKALNALALFGISPDGKHTEAYP